MVTRPANPYRSANAGEFSADASGRIDVKQYYSAALAMKNVEPVPQSGFRQMGGTIRLGNWRQPLTGLAISSPSVTAGSLTGSNVQIWTGTVSTLKLAALSIEGLAISAGTATFKAQCFIGAVWVDIGHVYGVKAGTPATRLAAFEPGKGRATNNVRIVASFSGTATVTIAAVRAFVEDGVYVSPRIVDLTTDQGDAIVGFVTQGVVDFWTEDGWQGAALLETVTEAMLPRLDFYAEADTIGVFHGELETLRIRRMDAPSINSWTVDDWPYDPVPKADLGGVYATTDDKWSLGIRFVGNIEQWIVLTVNGESTPAIAHRNAGGTVIAFPAFTLATYTLFAAAMQTELEALPGLGPGVTVTATGTSAMAAGGYFTFEIVFGGALSGKEYDVTATMVNTADAAALTYHTQFGKTDTEALFSPTRGWPGGVALVQDRQALCRIPAAPGALALSRTAEYFDFDVEGQTDDAARLDRLRSLTTETILCVKESKYLLVFTDRGVFFVTNRVLTRKEPLNFVQASEVGIQPDCKPIDLEGIVYYVAINPQGLANAADGGNQLVTTVYDDVSTTYNSEPVSLLASHLCQKMIRLVRQKAQADQDASRGWILRSDGRVICAQIIRNQEITGFCEWRPAAEGVVRDIRVDGRNRLWLSVFRPGSVTVEIYDQAVFLQDATTRTANLSGVVDMTGYLNGDQVWVVPPGFSYGLGPFSVSAGVIQMEDYYPGNLLVGRWRAPYFESMPEVLVTQNDDIVIRPGRIHTAHINMIDTASIAVGANGSTPRDVTLLDINDVASSPMPAKTKHLTVTGLPGMKEYTTLVITQTRPGTLRVKDYAVERKL